MTVVGRGEVEVGVVRPARRALRPFWTRGLGVAGAGPRCTAPKASLRWAGSRRTGPSGAAQPRVSPLARSFHQRRPPCLCAQRQAAVFGPRGWVPARQAPGPKERSL